MSNSTSTCNKRRYRASSSSSYGLQRGQYFGSAPVTATGVTNLNCTNTGAYTAGQCMANFVSGGSATLTATANSAESVLLVFAFYAVIAVAVACITRNEFAAWEAASR